MQTFQTTTEAKKYLIAFASIIQSVKKQVSPFSGKVYFAVQIVNSLGTFDGEPFFAEGTIPEDLPDLAAKMKDTNLKFL